MARHRSVRPGNGAEIRGLTGKLRLPQACERSRTVTSGAATEVSPKRSLAGCLAVDPRRMLRTVLVGASGVRPGRRSPNPCRGLDARYAHLTVDVSDQGHTAFRDDRLLQSLLRHMHTVASQRRYLECGPDVLAPIPLGTNAEVGAPAYHLSSPRRQASSSDLRNQHLAPGVSCANGIARAAVSLCRAFGVTPRYLAAWRVLSQPS